MRGKGCGGGGRLFEAGLLLTFSAFSDGRLFEVGATSRWALLQGWALIRINTVIKCWRESEFPFNLGQDRLIHLTGSSSEG